MKKIRNNSFWLSEGEQSTITPLVKKIASRFKGHDIEKIWQILIWMDKNLTGELNRKRILSLFATRTAEEIIQSKKETGRHDTAVVLVTLLRACHIPAKYLLGIDKERPRKGGHCAAQALVNDEWIIIDPSYFKINLISSRSDFLRENYLARTGLDSWDCGVKTVKDWDKLSKETVLKLP
jgi:hypothetical protein